MVLDVGELNQISEPKVYLFLGYGPITRRIINRLVRFEQPIIHLITERQVEVGLPSSVNIWKPSEAMIPIWTVSFNIVVNSWRSLDSPNVMSRKKILVELASINKRIQLINLSSVAVYGDSNSFHTEATVPDPVNQYGRNKLEVEMYLDFLGFFRVQNLRIANVFGDINLRDVINSIVEAGINHSKISLSEPSKVFRDFIHIDIVVEFVLTLFHVLPDIDYETINVGSGKSISLLEVVEICNEILGVKLDFSIIGLSSDEILASRINVEKFQSRFEVHGTSSYELLREYITEMREHI